MTIGDASIDGWYRDDDQEAFFILQAKWMTHIEENPTFSKPNELRAFPPVYSVLCNLPLAATHGQAAKKVALELRDALDAGYTPVMEIVVAGKLSQTLGTQLDNLMVSSSAGLDPPVLAIWNLERLYTHYVASETSEDLSGIEVVLPLASPEKLTVDMAAIDGVHDAAVVTLDLEGFGKAVRKHVPRIYDANVRQHLGVTNRTNRGIRESLAEEEGRRTFWLHNNGLTILANSVVLADDLSEVTLTNPQVVNGCQTTQAIVDTLPKLKPGDGKVLARIIQVDEGEAGAAASLGIAEKTNSQSPVKGSDLKSNRVEQKELQAAFASLEPKWFYQRKRGEWQQMTKSAKDPFKPGRWVAKEDIAQEWVALVGEPHKAILSKNAQWEGSLYKKIFLAGNEAPQFLLAHLMFSSFNDIVVGGEADVQARIQQYTSSFTVSVLKRLTPAKKTWTAHLTAMSAALLKVRYGELTPNVSDRLCKALQGGGASEWTFIFRGVMVPFGQWAHDQDADANFKHLMQQEGTIGLLCDRMSDWLRDVDGGLTGKLPPLPA